MGSWFKLINIGFTFYIPWFKFITTFFFLYIILRFKVLVTFRGNVEAFRAFFKSVIISSPIHVSYCKFHGEFEKKNSMQKKPFDPLTVRILSSDLAVCEVFWGNKVCKIEPLESLWEVSLDSFESWYDVVSDFAVHCLPLNSEGI